jgi:hypothetical protein
MKRLVALVLALVIAAGTVATVSALNMSETTEQSIRDNCAEMQAQIRRLQIADANVRVALGRSYDRVSLELMTNFIKRAETDGRNVDELTHLSNEFIRFARFFRETYIQYDNEVRRVLQIDCTVRPVEFYAGVNRLRGLRGGVRSNADRLIRITEQFREEVEMMRDEDNG